jgi:hypothetical protein
VFVVVGALAAALAPLGAAHADSTVVVRGLGFAAGSSTNLAVLGCSDLYSTGGASPATYLSPSPGGPAGERSLKYDLAGGVAVGSQHRVASLQSTTVAGLSVLAPHGTTGVAYAAYQAPGDAGTDTIWVGRAALTVAAGAWREVQAPGLTYTWTRYDLATRAPAGRSAGSATVPDFQAGHGGDGAGFYALGLGCDGNPFKIDALRTGASGDVTTYDLEGYTTATGISGSATRVAAGDDVTVSGQVASDMIGPLAQGLLVLEAQQYGEDGFSPVEGAAVRVSGGEASATVQPRRHTVYRWRFGGSSSAGGSVSPPFTVDVAAVVTAQTVTTDGARAVVGTVLPARAGSQVTLWQATASGPVSLGGSVVDTAGAYRIPVPEDVSGRWSYFVTVPAGEGNLAGQSATVVVDP